MLHYASTQLFWQSYLTKFLCTNFPHFILYSLVLSLSLSSLWFSFFTHFIHYIISFPCCYYFLNVLVRCLLDILLTFETHVFTTHITVLYGMENWFLRLSFVPCAGVSGDQSSIRILLPFCLKFYNTYRHTTFLKSDMDLDKRKGK